MNITLRDAVKFDKLRVLKVIHAFVHKRVFIFYQKPAMFSDLAKMLIEAFTFSEEASRRMTDPNINKTNSS
jgi:hypothetical protein